MGGGGRYEGVGEVSAGTKMGTHARRRTFARPSEGVLTIPAQNVVSKILNVTPILRFKNLCLRFTPFIQQTLAQRRLGTKSEERGRGLSPDGRRVRRRGRW